MPALHNAVRAHRARAGLTQEQLARRVALSRQAVNAVELGRSEPSSTVALRLARALGCRFEELFWLEDVEDPVRAELAADARPSDRVALAEIGGRWIAHPLPRGDAASLRVAADGLLRAPVRTLAPRRPVGEPRRIARVQPLHPLASARDNLIAVGCDPALGVLAARLAERFPPVRLLWLDAASQPALETLERGQAHFAGSHLLDETTGEFNVPFVRALFPGRRMLVVTLASWEEGFAVAPRNPLRIRRAGDLARPGLRLMNRAPGSGARRLLDRLLDRAGVPARSVPGYDRLGRGHLDVAQAVATGAADVGIVPRGVALAQGLDFVALARERFDLVLPFESAEDERIARTLETLRSRSFRRELSSLGGYDASRSGEMVAEVSA